MPIVLLFDQRNSSATPDLVGPASAALNNCFESTLTLPFVRSSGDEMQAVLGDPEALAPLLTKVLDELAWWPGLGIGEITRLGASAPESAGPAFRAAREAVDAAKRERGAPAPAVRGEPADLAESLQAALAGLAFIRGKRTERQREVVAAVRKAETQKAAAEKLGVTHQAVSDALTSAGYAAEQQLQRLVGRLAAQATG